MLRLKDHILRDGRVRKTSAVAKMAPRVIILVTSLNRWVRSMTVLARTEPTTPDMM